MRSIVWVVVPLTVPGVGGDIGEDFLFDTGCQITTVSEDVATKLGPPSGGRPIGMRGSTGSGSERFVDVRFRFPNTVSGLPGLEVRSTWAVVSGRQNLALLGFMEVHRHFQIRALEFDLYFIPWASVHGR